MSQLPVNKCTLLLGDCLEHLKQLPNDSCSSLVTDPPAGIAFMGKDWDSDKGGRDAWVAWMAEIMTEALRVLKPGAHGLVWALPRTSHWTATALENAGFEVRDVVTHLFGTGFPKSLNIALAIDKGMPYETTSDAAKQWQGWGTALKPASEHWILVRKPCSEKTVAANVLKHGVGGLNIDASRVTSGGDYHDLQVTQGGKRDLAFGMKERQFEPSSGRFPANLVLDEDAAKALDEQSGASRFFYVAKASKSDKGEGNVHPTVKSTTLMSYLITLITPPGGVVLDPFTGSGSTGVAALSGGFRFLGIEKEQEYFEIAAQRLRATQE